LLKPSILYPLVRGAKLFPSRWVSGPDGRVTYSEMLDRVYRLAGWLRSEGFGRGDVIAVADVNTVRFMELAYAVGLTGSVILPLNFRQPPGILAEILEESGAQALFYSKPFEGFTKLKPRLKQYDLDAGYSGWLESGPFEGEADPDADYVLLYTSGATGKPKGIMYSQWKMFLGGHSIVHQLSLHKTPAELRSGDTMLSLIPMFHIMSWGSIYIAPMIGANLVFVDKFEPEKIARIIREKRVTWFNAVPTMLAMLLSTGERFPGLKAIVGGSALPVNPLPLSPV